MTAFYQFRKANQSDVEAIWRILRQAIERRRQDGSHQWQDGYPNPEVIEKDILRGHGYVLLDEDRLVAYTAIMTNNEPAYDTIDGKWLTAGTDFLVLHRIAVENNYLGQGIAKRIFGEAEKIACSMGIASIRVDTNFDNQAMLHVVAKLGYAYCGEVILRGGARKAFEKVLSCQKQSSTV
ncbi:MAG: GNAT family N-acetyltransferase [Bacteroidales bacterium 45-6]|nr:MAG: GNAT family N-acetyltransferase [Bacteroidales bacterium 45-6]